MIDLAASLALVLSPIALSVCVLRLQSLRKRLQEAQRDASEEFKERHRMSSELSELRAFRGFASVQWNEFQRLRNQNSASGYVNYAQYRQAQANLGQLNLMGGLLGANPNHL